MDTEDLEISIQDIVKQATALKDKYVDDKDKRESMSIEQKKQ